MTYTKPVKKGSMTKQTAPRSRLSDEEEHLKRLDRARSEKDRQELKRIRELTSAARKKLLR
jgi:hypothetical protein